MSKWKLVPVEATDQMIDAALDAKIGGKSAFVRRNLLRHARRRAGPGWRRLR